MGKKLTTEEFINNARRQHNDRYDYSKTSYVDYKTKVCVTCHTHGDFWIKPSSHTSTGKSGCYQCGLITKVSGRKLSNESFIKKSTSIHGDKYNYSKVEYINSKTKVCIICPEHGEFWQIPNSHLKGRGCPSCKSSHGERTTHNWLETHDVKHEVQYTYNDLVGNSGYPLRFDFYLPELNTCIEYDGVQHYTFKKGMMTEQKYITLQYYDKRKNEYCNNNNIRLIRIRYDEDINDRLNDELSNIEY